MYKNACIIAVAGMVSATLLPAYAQTPDPGANITLEVTLDNRDLSYYATFVSDITIKNPNSFPIDATDISCPVLGPSGSMIQRYDFQVSQAIPARGAMTLKKHRFGYWPIQAVSVTCTGSKRP
jgi:hypothetical protein